MGGFPWLGTRTRGTTGKKTRTERRLSFRAVFLCVFLPPILYLLTLQATENVLGRKWRNELRTNLISDTDGLLHGRVQLGDEIEENIDRYLAGKFMLHLGVRARISVKTGKGHWLYPRVGTAEAYDPEGFREMEPAKGPMETLRVGERNLELLGEGLDLELEVHIPGNTVLSNGILGLYVFLFSLLLYRLYRKGTVEAEVRAKGDQEALTIVRRRLTAVQDRLRLSADKETRYQEEIERLRAELVATSRKARAAEEDALTEIEEMERNLEENLEKRRQTEAELKRLQEEMLRLTQPRKPPPRKKDKQLDAASKRFRTLYRNLEFTARAVGGFLDLPNELQLRAEQLIHTLNEDSAKLTVRRKVFSKKGSIPVLESEFGYKGRLYWRRETGGKVQVVCVGTKNTQQEDLAYLESL